MSTVTPPYYSFTLCFPGRSNCEFRCKQSGDCIKLYQVCNYVPDCGGTDHSDEEDCQVNLLLLMFIFLPLLLVTFCFLCRAFRPLVALERSLALTILQLVIPMMTSATVLITAMTVRMKSTAVDEVCSLF